MKSIIVPIPKVEKDEKGEFKRCAYCGAKMYKADTYINVWNQKKFCSPSHRACYRNEILQYGKLLPRIKPKKTKIDINGIKSHNELEHKKPKTHQKVKVVQVPAKYHLKGKPFSNFRNATYYIAPQVNLEDYSARIHISLRAYVRGYWAYGGVFNIEEADIIKMLRILKEYKEIIKKNKDKLKVNEYGTILEV